MMKKIGSLIFSCLSLSACVPDRNFYRGYSSPEIDATITAPVDTIMKALLEGDESKTGRGPIITLQCANAGTAVNDPTRCIAQRNDAIYTLMTGSEQFCLIHRRSIYGRDASFNITAGTLTSLFAGISTVVTPTVTKSIFSALAMFTNSERSLVNEVVYKQMLVPAVDSKIVQTRDTKARAIAQHLKNDDLTTYPLSRAINDFMEFHNSCSFMEGLRLALADGVQNPTETRINNLNNRMLLNNAQMNIYCPGKNETDKQMCASLKARNTAITEELKTLEVQ